MANLKRKEVLGSLVLAQLLRVFVEELLPHGDDVAVGDLLQEVDGRGGYN